MTNFKDERVEQTKHKIRAELMLIIYYIVLISFMAKALYFHMDLKQCMTEYIILILAPLYQTFRSRQLGVVLNGNGPKSWKVHIPLMLVCILMVLFLWLQNDSVPAEARNFSALLSLGIFVAVFLTIHFIFLRLEEKRAKKLERKFDDED